MELKKRIRNRKQNSEFDSSGDSSDDNIPLSRYKQVIKDKKPKVEYNSTDEVKPMSIDTVKKISNDQQIMDTFSDMTKCLKSILVKEYILSCPINKIVYITYISVRRWRIRQGKEAFPSLIF